MNRSVLTIGVMGSVCCILLTVALASLTKKLAKKERAPTPAEAKLANYLQEKFDNRLAGLSKLRLRKGSLVVRGRTMTHRDLELPEDLAGEIWRHSALLEGVKRLDIELVGPTGNLLTLEQVKPAVIPRGKPRWIKPANIPGPAGKTRKGKQPRGSAVNTR